MFLCIGCYVFVTTRFVDMELVSHRDIYLHLVLPFVKNVSLHIQLRLGAVVINVIL
jgi:hypothetical protein